MDGFIDMCGIDQRTVAGHLHDDVRVSRCLDQALPDIIDRPAMDAAIDAPAQIRNDLIRRATVVATTTSPTNFARRTRSTSRCNIGAPASGNMTLPGSRVAAMRASMVAMIRILMTEISDARMLAWSLQ